jgi:hypothetical protein
MLVTREQLRSAQASAGDKAHFLSSAGQFVTNVMDVDLVWSVALSEGNVPNLLKTKP